MRLSRFWQDTDSAILAALALIGSSRWNPYWPLGGGAGVDRSDGPPVGGPARGTNRRGPGGCSRARVACRRRIIPILLVRLSLVAVAYAIIRLLESEDPRW
jgi:hypothetical protein